MTDLAGERTGEGAPPIWQEKIATATHPELSFQRLFTVTSLLTLAAVSLNPDTIADDNTSHGMLTATEGEISHELNDSYEEGYLRVGVIPLPFFQRVSRATLLALEVCHYDS